ncbi:MAG TPA: glycosyltransferase 87 family protein [Thermoguttaceae bacterium]|nr:glycosyltransferase 87 family protein [Thermoguttaceae bacterium]
MESCSVSDRNETPLCGLIVGAVVAGVATVSLLLATSPGLPMTWDEGNAIWRSQGIQRWFERLVAPDRADSPPSALSKDGIAECWRYTTQIEGHPALYGMVIAAGRWVSGAWLRPLDSYRFGPILLFALAAGAMFYRMARQYSIAAALGAVAALMLLPRMLAHAHFASFDGPLVACWVLAWAAFAPARRSWPAAILFGIALGMTLSAKATGWLAPLGFLAWTLVYRDRAGAKAMAWGVPIALATFFLLNPPLWHDPIRGGVAFFQMNLGRSEFNISTQFFGRMYNLDHPLPWYNTLVWTGITVPIGILLLMAVGVAVVLRRWRDDRAGTLLLANALVLLIVRAVPGVPPHDGVRLFLPSFAFLAALAGVGAASVLAFVARRPNGSVARRRAAVVGVLVLYAGSATSAIWYAPQWLSYYNLAVGGLPGATALGMEPTYYWDGLDRSVLDWLHTHTTSDEKVLFGPVPTDNVQAGPTENLRQMQKWGLLGRRFEFTAPGRYRWYVLQRRPSGMWPADHWLVANCQPAHRKTIRKGGWGPWRLDVPLVEVYSHSQYLEACETVRPARTQHD